MNNYNAQIYKDDSITSAKEGLAKWLIYYDNKFYVEILWKENKKGHWTTFEFKERNNEDYHSERVSWTRLWFLSIVALYNV